jgi:peroxiredoxin
MMVKTIGFLAMALMIQPVFSQDVAGKWRGEFTIQDTVKVPFNFEISESGKVFLLNADERFESGNIRTKGDSLFIPLDQFDNELAFRISGKQLQGVLRKQDGGFLANVAAQKGITYRFKPNTNRPSNISGKYKLVFRQANGNEEEAIGIFKQTGKRLHATFLKPSGDTRFLDGIVEGNNFYLSSFIGSTPGYYHGVISDKGEFNGEQIGTRVRIKIKGEHDEKAELATTTEVLVNNDSLFHFSLPDINGRMISLKDEKYRDKVVIIAVTGTWCPNCIDEAQFLSPWYKKNKDRGVEIVLVHFERQADTAFANKVMRRFRQRFDITYDQVFGGITAKDTVIKALPGLKDFNFYPTTVILNKKGNIAKIHTGFSGPATGKYYDDFVKEFNEEVDELLAE